MMTFGSLFAGIGGFDLGLERAGMECRWQVEIDDYASRVLAKHWPHVTRWGDICTFPTQDINQWRVDVICAGPPCQPVSVAGRRKGKSDERWLWGECLRVVAALNPKVFVAENPTGLLSDDRGRTFGGIIAALAAVGFHCDWNVISAADLGAPHRRERVWLVARKNACVGQVSMLRGPLVPDTRNTRTRVRVPGRRGVVEQSVLSPHRMADTRGEGLEGAVSDDSGPRLLGFRSRAWADEAQDVSDASQSWWEVESGVCRMAHGIRHRVDRLRCLGNSVVPQVAETVARAIVQSLGVNA